MSCLDVYNNIYQLYFSVFYTSLSKASCIKNGNKLDFPGDAVVGNLPDNAGDTGSSPGPGRSHMPRSN